MRLGKGPNATIREKNSNIYALAVIDAQFRLLGESIVPQELQPLNPLGSISMLMTPEGLYF